MSICTVAQIAHPCALVRLHQIHFDHSFQYGKKHVFMSSQKTRPASDAPQPVIIHNRSQDRTHPTAQARHDPHLAAHPLALHRIKVNATTGQHRVPELPLPQINDKRPGTQPNRWQDPLLFVLQLLSIHSSLLGANEKQSGPKPVGPLFTDHRQSRWNEEGP